MQTYIICNTFLKMKMKKMHKTEYFLVLLTSSKHAIVLQLNLSPQIVKSKEGRAYPLTSLFLNGLRLCFYLKYKRWIVQNNQTVNFLVLNFAIELLHESKIYSIKIGKK